MRNVLRLPRWLHRRVDETAKLYGISHSDIISEVLEAFFRHATGEQVEYLANLVRQKRTEGGHNELEEGRR